MVLLQVAREFQSVVLPVPNSPSPAHSAPLRCRGPPLLRGIGGAGSRETSRDVYLLTPETVAAAAIPAATWPSVCIAVEFHSTIGR